MGEKVSNGAGCDLNFDESHILFQFGRPISVLSEWQDGRISNWGRTNGATTIWRISEGRSWPWTLTLSSQKLVVFYCYDFERLY